MITEVKDQKPGDSSTGVFVVLLLVALAPMVWGIFLDSDSRPILVGLGVVALVVVSCAWMISGGKGTESGIAPILQQQTELLKSINERMKVSDQAKRILYREQDRETLRGAIVEDIRKEDYDAALVLVNEMSEVFGYREEAEEFREKIQSMITNRQEKVIQKAIARIEDICQRREWDVANQEAKRLKRISPDDPRIDRLPEIVEEARNGYKNELIELFREAYRRNDTERSMEYLRELDKYLTPDEAGPYTNMAREVIAKKRENLGIQFKLAMEEKEWDRARQTGEQIVKEFPNSKMADEVRDLLDKLRQRAAQQPAAGRGGG